MDFLKKSWQDITCVLVFLLISFFYFMTPVTDGLVLHGDDNTGGLGMGHELKEYYEATGEHTRWTNSTFSGMPTYQIAPSYDSANLLMQIQHIYQLGTSAVLSVSLPAGILYHAARLQYQACTRGFGQHSVGFLVVFPHYHSSGTYLEGDDALFHPANHRRLGTMLSR